VHEHEHPEDWRAFIREWLHAYEVEGNIVILTEGPSPKHPEANNRMEIIDLGRKGEA
jgi:pyruvate kinase